jgi:hypothetical protein
MSRWPFVEITHPQRSPEWHLARAGRLTGSRAGDVLAKIKTGEAAARRDYRMQLVTERLTGLPQEDSFVNAAMQRGIDLEPVARAALEARQGYLIEESGFLSCTELQAGCSLDGHVEAFEGIIELKCPKSATHLRYLTERTLPKEHRPQVLHNLLVTGAKWLDFASYDDRFPERLRLWVIRVTADELMQELYDYEREAQTFLAEVELDTEKVRKL